MSLLLIFPVTVFNSVDVYWAAHSKTWSGPPWPSCGLSIWPTPDLEDGSSSRSWWTPISDSIHFSTCHSLRETFPFKLWQFLTIHANLITSTLLYFSSKHFSWPETQCVHVFLISGVFSTGYKLQEDTNIVSIVHHCVPKDQKRT